MAAAHSALRALNVQLWGPGGAEGRTQPALLSLDASATCEAGRADLCACGSPGFAQLSTPHLRASSDGRSSPPDLQTPLPCRAVPVAGSLGALWWAAVSCEPCGHGPTCSGQRLHAALWPCCCLHPPRPEQRELVHHEEHGHRAGHRPHWLLHPRACHPGEASGSAAWAAWSPLLSRGPVSRGEGGPPLTGSPPLLPVLGGVL